MPKPDTPRNDQPTPRDQRHALLTHLAAAVRRHGGTAVLALGHTAHPVLYVRAPHAAYSPPHPLSHSSSRTSSARAVPVVLIPDARGGWRFVWGRTGWADSSRAEEVAAHLAAALVPRPSSPSGLPNPPGPPASPPPPPPSPPPSRAAVHAPPTPPSAPRTPVSDRPAATRKAVA